MVASKVNVGAEAAFARGMFRSVDEARRYDAVMLRARPAAIAVAVAAFAVACAEDGAILPGADAASAADASTTVTDAATPDVVWSEAAGRGVTFDKLTLDT